MEMRVGAAPIFVQFGRAIAVGLLLLFAAFNASALAQDGPKAAAAAKEAAANMQAYLRDLEKSKGQPDYSKPPVSEYIKRIFNADTLSALPAPKAEDFDWVGEWFESVNQSYGAIALFNVKDRTTAEGRQAVIRNLEQYEDTIWTAYAFQLRLMARVGRTTSLNLDSLPPDQRSDASKAELDRFNSVLVQAAIGTARTLTTDLKPKNLRLLATALHDTVTVWVPLATPQERTSILAQLEKSVGSAKKSER
jgi:hypothetical protein